MTTIKPWGGRRAQKLTRATLAAKGRACVLALPGCTRVATTAHHVIPHSLGGPDTLDNLVPACLPCNQRQGARVNVDGRPAEASDPRDWFDTDCQAESHIVDGRVFKAGALLSGRTPAPSPPALNQTGPAEPGPSCELEYSKLSTSLPRQRFGVVQFPNDEPRKTEV